MIRACIVLALATCAVAGYVGYPATYTYSAPVVATYQAPGAAVSTVYPAPYIAAVANVPTFGYGNGFPAYGYGFDTYSLSLDGVGGLGYSTLLKKYRDCTNKLHELLIATRVGSMPVC